MPVVQSTRARLALILIVALGVLAAFQLQVAFSAERVQPASIPYSIMLPADFSVMTVDHKGVIYVGGVGVEALRPGDPQVKRVLALPGGKVRRETAPVSWVRALAAGGGVVAATGTTTRPWPTPKERGRFIRPRGASTLVVWRQGAHGPDHYLTLGGTCNQSPGALAVDSHGTMVVAGVTTSDNFPLVHPVQARFAGLASNPFCPPTWKSGLQNGDVFLTRIDRDGRITYSTYLGGSQGDEPRAVAIDDAGDIYVAGITFSADFPHVRGFERRGHGAVNGSGPYCTANACLRDFIARLDPSGKLAWLTMLPLGSYSGEVHGMAVGATGVYLVGDTISADLPTVRAYQPSYGGGSCEDYDGMGIRCRDAWITKLTTGGKVAFTTYLGGSGDDVGSAIAVDRRGRVYVGGTTDSIGLHVPDFWFRDFPRLRNVEGSPGGAGRCALPTPCGDAYVAELTSAGNLVASWALGGSDNEDLMGLGVDADGHVYATGYTASCDFPLRGGTRLHPFPSSCPATFVTELRAP